MPREKHAPDPETNRHDMVTFFVSNHHDAEQEAMLIHGILEANDIPSVIVGTSLYPIFEFRVEVSRDRLEEAERVVAEARAAGPAAAAEAEAASEDDV